MLSKHIFKLKNKKSVIIVYIGFITAVFLWGSSFAGMKIALKFLHPWTVMWFRMAGAFIALIPFAKKIIPKKLTIDDLKVLIPMMLLQPCLYFFLESTALLYTSSSQAGIVSALVPVFASIGAYFIFSEKMGLNKISGMILSIIGIIMLTAFQDQNSTAVNPLLGNTLEVLAMASVALCMIMVKKLSTNFNPWTLTAMQVSAGLIFFSPGLVIFISEQKFSYDLSLYLILLYMGVFITLGAFGLYNWGITKIPVGQASILINLVPVVAVIIGWIFLGESLNIWQILAGLIVLTGVFIK